MKRFIIFLVALVIVALVYNFPIILSSFRAFSGNISYNDADFQNARKQYSDFLKTLSGSILLNSDVTYNLGDAFYRLGEKETGEKRIALWEQSLDAFSGALSLHKDRQTEENYAFVKQKLEKEKQEGQKRKDEQGKAGIGSTGEGQPTNTESTEESQKTGTGGESSGKTDEQSEEQDTSKPMSGKTWTNNGSYNSVGGQDKTEKSTPLSSEQRKELENYIRSLHEFQKQNGQLLDPDSADSNGSVSDQIQKFFGNNSFFQDALPDGAGKKDW